MQSKPARPSALRTYAGRKACTPFNIDVNLDRAEWRDIQDFALTCCSPTSQACNNKRSTRLTRANLWHRIQSVAKHQQPHTRATATSSATFKLHSEQDFVQRNIYTQLANTTTQKPQNILTRSGVYDIHGTSNTLRELGARCITTRTPHSHPLRRHVRI